MIIVSLPSLAKAINDEKLLVDQLAKTYASERQRASNRSLPLPAPYQPAKTWFRSGSDRSLLESVAIGPGARRRNPKFWISRYEISDRPRDFSGFNGSI